MMLLRVAARPGSAEAIPATAAAIVTYTFAWPELAAKLDCRLDCLCAKATRASLGVEDQHECA